MKKQMNADLTAGKKLRLNKKTISNLASPVRSNNFWEIGPSKNPQGCFTRKCNTF
ncbi:MAG TPA: hypothetical protein VMZ03_01030 [Chitinophagaceae bacterium]|nr:hypothetical protein [Chitinophagaceae bacterium]